MGRGRVHITSLVTLHVYGKNQRGKAEFKEGWPKLEKCQKIQKER